MCDLCVATQNFDPSRHLVSGTLEWPDPEPAPVEPDPLPDGTLDQFASYLTTGFWSDNNSVQHSFSATPGNSAGYVIEVNLTGITSAAQRLARWALESWELAADIQFVEVESGGDIIVDDEESGAFAQSEFMLSDPTEIITSYVNVDQAWLDLYGVTLDSYAFSTYVHEFGHALGLGHLGNYNFTSGGATFANDSYQYSVMSYIPQDQVEGGTASYAQPTSAMMADMVAIQQLYGTSNAAAGDTTWGQGNTMSRHFATLYAGVDDGDPATEERDPIAFTLFDGVNGGTDTIDLRNSTTNDRLDLNDGSFSDVADLTSSLAIARGSQIENARMGSGNDTVVGNELDNQITGHGGRDALNGGGGSDRLSGGGGRDQLFGGAMNDRLFGNRGADRLDSGEGDDLMVGGRGADEFFFGFGHDSDKIRDFTLGRDELLFSALEFDGLTAEQLVNEYGTVGRRGVTLDFGDSEVLGADANDSLRLIGVFDLNALADDITFI